MLRKSSSHAESAWQKRRVHEKIFSCHGSAKNLGMGSWQEKDENVLISTLIVWKSRETDLNRRPMELQSIALPLSYHEFYIERLTHFGWTHFGWTHFGWTHFGWTHFGWTHFGWTHFGWTHFGWTHFGWTHFGWTHFGWTHFGWTHFGWTLFGWTHFGWTHFGWTHFGWTHFGWTHFGWIINANYSSGSAINFMNPVKSEDSGTCASLRPRLYRSR